MKIAILGSGNVGQALGKAFLAEGHDVWLATREPAEPKADEIRRAVEGAEVVDFASAAQNGELIVLATPWSSAQNAIELAGTDALRGKIMIDTNNVITQAEGTMVYGFDARSAAEQVQAWLPDSKVVKAFNTVGADLMYKPSLSGTPTMFLAGDDGEAKQVVAGIAASFGWEPLDAGSLICARELEAMALVWIRNAMANGGGHAFKML